MVILFQTAFVLIVSAATAQLYDDVDFQEQIVKNEIEIASLELRDECENLANVYKSALVTNTFDEKLKVKEAHGELLKIQTKNLKLFENDVSADLMRNWTLFTKPGDALLSDEDWNTLVSYEVANDELIHTARVHCQNETESCVYIKSGYEKLFETSRNETLLSKSWSAWQTLVSAKKKDFPHILNFINKAATLNGYLDKFKFRDLGTKQILFLEKGDAAGYWEMLTEMEDGYDLADGFWEQIKPLYEKLREFVKKQLFLFYGIDNEHDGIPVYLLGSNFGNDWSHIADIILPYPQMYQQAENYIKKKTVKDIYKIAEEATLDLSLGPLGPKFWTNSLFNMTFCENHIITDCIKEYSALLTCDRTTWATYLDSFENAIEIALRNQNFVALSQMNLRHSVLDEALKNLGTILAVKTMTYKGVWDQNLFLNNDDNSNKTEIPKMTELLLIALRVLPKLPYYLAADKWRLDILESGFDHFEQRWWEFRKDYQGVTSVTNNESDFLSDSFITSNRPYLSKFLGTILMFQILAYYDNSWQDLNESFAINIAKDENFLLSLRERSLLDWPSLLSHYYAIYELSADAILTYFAPLNDFLDNVSLGQYNFAFLEPTTTETPHNLNIMTETPHKLNNAGDLQSKSLNNLTKENVGQENDDISEGPHFPPVHEHVEENLEGPNHVMETISTYIGVVLLVVVAGIIIYVVVSKKMRKKRRNNRRFET